jgi:hypothetical protein
MVAAAAPRCYPRNRGPHGPEHETREGMRQPVDIELWKIGDVDGSDDLPEVEAGSTLSGQEARGCLF